MINLFKREIFIIKHGQTKKLRLIKWIIILTISLLLFFWQGLEFIKLWIIFWMIFGLSLHFFFRWKTNGWTKAWGPAKLIKTPYDTLAKKAF